MHSSEWKWVVIVLMLLGVIACEQKPDAGRAIDYKRRQAEFSVKLVFLSQSQVRERCATLGAWEGRAPKGAGGYVGCNAFDTETKTVTIYASEPTHVDDAAVLTLGHEVLHAYGGHYHD
jgi:hypothetical protein